MVTPSQPNAPIRFGISAKLSFLLATFCVLAIGSTGYYTNHATQEILIEKTKKDLVSSTQIMGRRFSMMADDVAKDALYFSGLASIRKVLGAGPNAQIAKRDLEEQFKSLLSERSRYSQVRFISAQDNGLELVRVDRHDDNSLVVVRGADLQEKRHYPYVYETLRLDAGQVHYSNIFINREMGAGAGYKQPTLQVSTPITNQEGQVLGVLVINVDLNQMFTVLKADLRNEYQLYLANQDGDFLIHPDSAMTFGFDYGRRFLIQESFQPVSQLIEGAANAVEVSNAPTDKTEGVAGGFARIPFGTLSKSSFVILGLTVPFSTVLAEADNLASNNLLIIEGLSLAAIMMSALVGIFFARPLRRLVSSVENFSDTYEVTPALVARNDEIGLLAKSINQMQENIQIHLANLNIQNEKLSLEMIERERIEKFDQFRSNTLELLASDKPITEVLLHVVKGVEELNAAMCCSILLLDSEGRHLVKGIAPSLPDFYNAAIEGIGIGMGVGSCGTAAFTGKRVVVENIQTHPYWAAFKELAEKAELRSCWSQPILTSSGRVLGTFAIYHRNPFSPTEKEIHIIEQAARLASIAIEHNLHEEALHYSEQRFRDVTDAAGEYVWEINSDMAYTYVSNRCIDVKGYTPEELIGHAPMEFMPVEDVPSVRDIVNHAIANNIPFKLEHRDITKSGSVLWEEVSGIPFTDDAGRLIGLRGTGLNITQRKESEAAIKNLAFYDPLTKLPNRRLLMDRLQHALTSSARNGREGALLFLDLDNFKNLNDTLGHDIGDQLLQQVAQRLTSCVREGDTVARLGGDEFVVMLEELDEISFEAAAQTESIGEKILATLRLPYLLDIHEYHNTPSIGVTLFKDQGHTPEELMKHADIAMYQAKKSGRNTLRFFDPQMQESINARVALEKALTDALGNNEFQLHYQIQVDETDKPVGAEALIRWINQEGEVVQPDRFIPLAEETGQILQIGKWVIEAACEQLKVWQQNGLTRKLTLAVNVSAKQFRLASFVSQVKESVQRCDINPALLKFELTESLLLDDVANTIAIMNALHEIGVQFSLDDFGTGYSSLQYLKQLPLDQLKIDKSFVRDITTDRNDKAIVSTIIAMARGLGFQVIAEGVETDEQRLFLSENGCTRFQGYLFSKPLPIDQFEALLKRSGSHEQSKLYVA